MSTKSHVSETPPASPTQSVPELKLTPIQSIPQLQLTQEVPSEIPHPASFFDSITTENEVLHWGSDEEETESEQQQHYVDLYIRMEDMESAERASLSQVTDEKMTRSPKRENDQNAPNSIDFKASRDTIALMKKPINPATEIKRICLLKSFSCFIREKWCSLHSNQSVPSMSSPEEFARWVIFPTTNGGFLERSDVYPREGLQRLNFFLREYIATYRKADGDAFAPTTLSGHAFCIQQGIKCVWGYENIDILKDPIFASGDGSFRTVLDNKVRCLQGEGRHVSHHNVLSRTDLKTIFLSPSLSRANPRGYMNRLVFILGLCTGLRNRSLWFLTLGQLSRHMVDNVRSITVTTRIGSLNGTSKTEAGGLQHVGKEPVRVTIFDEVYDELKLNMYADFSDYIECREDIKVETDRLLLQCNPRFIAGRLDTYFKRQVMGKNSFDTIVKTVCLAENVRGVGDKTYATMHSLRSSMIQMLIEKGHSDVAILKRTGYHVSESLRNYNHLMGPEGMRQQRSLVGQPSGTDAPPAPEVPASNFNVAPTSSADLITQSPDEFPAAAHPTSASWVSSTIGSVNATTVNITVVQADQKR